MKAKIEQPKIPEGFIFTGYATFNWGLCLQKVYRTKKEAKAACIGSGKEGSTWEDIKDHYRIEKVKCIVIKNAEYLEQESVKIHELYTKPLKILKPLEDLWRKEHPHPESKFVIPDLSEFYKWIVEKIIVK